MCTSELWFQRERKNRSGRGKFAAWKIESARTPGTTEKKSENGCLFVTKSQTKSRRKKAWKSVDSWQKARNDCNLIGWEERRHAEIVRIECGHRRPRGQHWRMINVRWCRRLVRRMWVLQINHYSLHVAGVMCVHAKHPNGMPAVRFNTFHTCSFPFPIFTLYLIFMNFIFHLFCFELIELGLPYTRLCVPCAFCWPRAVNSSIFSFLQKTILPIFGQSLTGAIIAHSFLMGSDKREMAHVAPDVWIGLWFRVLAVHHRLLNHTFTPILCRRWYTEMLILCVEIHFHFIFRFFRVCAWGRAVRYKRVKSENL